MIIHFIHISDSLCHLLITWNMCVEMKVWKVIEFLKTIQFLLVQNPALLYVGNCFEVQEIVDKCNRVDEIHFIHVLFIYLTSDSKKLGQSAVVIHYCRMSQLF